MLRPLPMRVPDLDERRVERVGADPYVRVDCCDYSLDPRLAGRRVGLRISQQRIVAVALDTGEVAADHRRCFAKHRTLTDPRHLDALDKLRAARHGRAAAPAAAAVERRDLAAYDALIPA